VYTSRNLWHLILLRNYIRVQRMDVSQFVIYQEFLGFVCEKSVMKHVAS